MTKRLHVPVTLSRYFSMLLRSNIFAALLQVGKEKEKEGKGKGGTILDELEDCIRPGHLHSSSVCVCVCLTPARPRAELINCQLAQTLAH